jgi:hypothetical protein
MSKKQSINQLPSGGLGLSRNEWEQSHFKTDLNYTVFGTGYEGGYDVVFQEEKVWSIERQWNREAAVTPDEVEAESKTLIPTDHQLVKTYHPDGRPETVVNLYRSEWLKNRFNSESSMMGNWWTGGEPGNFTVQYNIYDYGVSRMLIAIGNNP